MIDREELTAALLADYKNELAGLSDNELLEHWKLQKGVKEMSPAQWAAIYETVGPPKKK